MTEQSDPAQVERTFLFTDLQGSTTAWEYAPTQMNDVLAGHDSVMREAIDKADGVVFSTAGDAFAAAFTEPEDAVRAAVTIQRELAAREWPQGLEPRVRMGIHRGHAYSRDDDYFGSTLNRTARLMSAAHGGQVVFSEEIRSAVPDLPDGVDAIDLGTHRLKDVAARVDVWQLVIDGMAASFPPLKTVEEAVVKVPQARSRFLGREAELADLRTVLQEPALVTLVVGGGTGKTRLAYEVAMAQADRQPDGVFAVELAEGGPEDVASRLVDVLLGDSPVARAEGADDPVRALTDHLADSRALIVLDNCEHVIDAAAEIVGRLSRACPQLSVVATSREPLGVADEVVYRLSTLPTDADAPEGSAAVQLFVDRANAVSPDWGSLASDGDDVARICAEVEGLPLAIELAAARCKAMTPAEITGRLDDAGLSLLQAGRGRAERHRSLDATIQWSYDLLDDDERLVLAAMSAFQGGAALAAVESVAVAVTPAGGYDAVESLVDKSLVATERVAGRVRFRLSEPIRQFATERLAELDAVTTAHQSHFEHYLKVAGNVAPDLDREGDPAVVERLTIEHDNFLAAIDRALANGEPRSAAKLARRLHVYWEETGNLATGADRLAAAVEAAPDDPAVVTALGALVPYEAMCGRLEQAAVRSEHLAPLLGEGIPGQLRAGAGFAIGFVEQAAGHFDRAIRLLSDAAGDAEDPFFVRQILFTGSYIAMTSRDLEASAELSARAHAVAGPVQEWFPAMIGVVDDTRSVLEGVDRLDALRSGTATIDAMGLRFRAFLASAAASVGFFHGDAPEDAARAWHRGLQLSRDMGHLWGSFMLLDHAAVSASTDDPAWAARIWGAVDAFEAAEGYQQWPVIDELTEPAKAVVADALGGDRAAEHRAGGAMPLSIVVDQVLDR